MILLIDNYDSFVHNLARYLVRLGHTTQVVRNDQLDVPQLAELRPDAIVLSPGPCTPREAGCSLEVVRRYWQQIPLLGVCLGHQVIAEAFGAQVVRAPVPMHGRASWVEHTGQGILQGVPAPFRVGRYHSLVVDEATLPPVLEVTARTGDGVVMVLEHRERPVVGVQFHPESVLTEYGYGVLAGFLRQAGLTAPDVLPEMVNELPPQSVQGTPWPREPITF